MSSNITQMAGNEPDTSSEAICERIETIVGPFNGDLADYLKRGQVPETRPLVRHARALAIILSDISHEPEIADNSAVAAVADLISGLLGMAEGIDTIESRRDPALQAARARVKSGEAHREALERGEGGNHDE